VKEVGGRSDSRMIKEGSGGDYWRGGRRDGGGGVIAGGVEEGGEGTGVITSGWKMGEGQSGDYWMGGWEWS
jgi:hypothetical protein